MPHSIDHVEIALQPGDGRVALGVTRGAARRDAPPRLDARGRQAVPDGRHVAAGAAHAGQKSRLIDVIEVWGGEVEGGLTDGLPPCVFQLRNALHDDLHDRG